MLLLVVLYYALWFDQDPDYNKAIVLCYKCIKLFDVGLELLIADASF